MGNEEQSAKMWSGRFREPLDPEFEAWQRSILFDFRLLRQETRASKAHATALHAAGVLDAAELAAIRAGLDAVAGRFADASVEAALALYPKAEDVHHLVELALTAEIGPLALKLHTGRSRNEQIATDLRLHVRAEAATLETALLEWVTALLEQARAAGDAVMPSYTHMQRAEPVLVAHWLHAYAEMLLRDVSRLEDGRRRLNRCPLGSGAVAGATLALDRRLAADELGFAAPTANSMDATSDRDFVLEYVQGCTFVALHASRFAEEIALFSSSEYGFVDLPERYSTGSSAMPQKKNPDLVELVRGKAGRIHGAATALTLTIKGQPLAYNKDMQETQEACFAVSGMATMIGLLAGFTRVLQFRLERMRAAAETGYLNAMAAATYLVGKGVAFRVAHEKIGNAVRFALEKGVELGELSLAELRQFGAEFAEDFYDAVALMATVDCHDVAGGTARRQVSASLTAAEAKLRRWVETLEREREMGDAGA